MELRRIQKAFSARALQCTSVASVQGTTSSTNYSHIPIEWDCSHLEGVANFLFSPFFIRFISCIFFYLFLAKKKINEWKNCNFPFMLVFAFWSNDFMWIKTMKKLNPHDNYVCCYFDSHLDRAKPQEGKRENKKETWGEREKERELAQLPHFTTFSNNNSNPLNEWNQQLIEINIVILFWCENPSSTCRRKNPI